MKNKLYILLLTVGIIISSCSSKTNTKKNNNIIQGHATKVELVPQKNKKIALSDIIKKIDIKFLETTHEALIGEIIKMEIDEDYFILNSVDKLVYVYDSLGNFKRKVGRLGRGPSELTHPNGFSIDKNKKEIWINNNYMKMLKYDYEGNFINSEDINIRFRDFCVGNNDFVYFHTGKIHNYDNNGKAICSNLWVQNKSKEFTTYFPYDSQIYPNGGLSFNTKIPFSKMADHLTFNYVFCDTIYSIISDTVSPLYVIEFGDKKTSIDFNSKSGDNMLKYMMDNKDNALYVQNVIENNVFLRFNYVMGTQIYEAFYNKNNHTTMEGTLINDLFGAPLTLISSKDEKFIGYMQAYDLKSSENIDKYIDAETIMKLKSIPQDNNPIIVEIELNDQL